MELGFWIPIVINCSGIASKGWRSGESTRLPTVWPGFKSLRRRHMWVEFVVVSLRCSEWFFSGYSGFPLSSKTNISKFQFDQELGRRRKTLWMCYLQIIIYLFFLFILVIWNPEYFRCIPDSKVQETRFHEQKFLGFRNPHYSPVILWKKIGQPATNCNRRFFNGFRLCNISLLTYQKSQ